VHPETSSISEGYDPSLSVMAVRPPIYPVSTYCFATAQQAAHHFEVALGKVAAVPGERESLIYARLNHPNAEMFEDALRSSSGAPRRRGVHQRHVGDHHGGAHAREAGQEGALPAPGLRRHRPLLPPDAPRVERRRHRGRRGGWGEALAAHGPNLAFVYVETPANPTLQMIDLGAMRAGSTRR
jgi:methionine-gamma-lyase